MAKVTTTDTPLIIVREYRDDKGKLESRWTYNPSITKFGPVLVEEFNLPPKERKKRTKKVG